MQIKTLLKVGSIFVWAGMLAALSPAPNLVPDKDRKHQAVATTDKDLEKFQKMAKNQGEVGHVDLERARPSAPEKNDNKAAHNLSFAHQRTGKQSSAEAAATLKAAQANLEGGKRSPMSLIIWLFIAACVGYGFVFFVRHWADKNIPAPRGSTAAKW
jgi:hypothetical protein